MMVPKPLPIEQIKVPPVSIGIMQNGSRRRPKPAKPKE
jgi:hypothetical protein